MKGNINGKERKMGRKIKEDIKTKKEEKNHKKMQNTTYKTKKKILWGASPPAPPTNNSSGVLNPPALTQNKILMAFTPLHLP